MDLEDAILQLENVVVESYKNKRRAAVLSDLLDNLREVDRHDNIHWIADPELVNKGLDALTGREVFDAVRAWLLEYLIDEGVRYE